ncbi:hypothetical protein B0H21DRAFT_779009 [Amylocystis lapponica]|nr:hypothetical protein B0H21DRAFT_779009 [Amylocystis lapponica]
MSLLLPSALAISRSQPFLLLQSSTAQSCLPILRHIVSRPGANTQEHIVVFCFLYAPSSFTSKAQLESENIRVYDWTGRIPGYSECPDTRAELLQAIRAGEFATFVCLKRRDSCNRSTAPPGPLSVIVDSVDTLFSDLGSLANTEQLLSEVLATTRGRNDASRLIVHALAPSPLIPLLTQTRFSPTLTHLTAHPPVLVAHLATAYLTPPPPLSSPEKFWRVFLPIAERHYESERLVFGAGGEGCGGKELVVEVLVRGPDASARRRGLERVLEGWSGDKNGGPCALKDLESLKSVWTRKVVEENVPDPTQNLSFNLNLTPEQQQSRAKVPLPYAHEGLNFPVPGQAHEHRNNPAAILYDPDSADDIDDDDPDEDLDI